MFLTVSHRILPYLRQIPIIAQVRSILKLDDAPFGCARRRFCSDQCVARYLRARGWDPVKAGKMLENTLRWREKEGVDNLRCAFSASVFFVNVEEPSPFVHSEESAA